MRTKDLENMEITASDPHTPGPWAARESSLSRDGNLWFIEVVNSHAQTIARVAEVYRPPNARLIAAAPELLEAIREYLDWGAMTGSDRDLFERKFRAVIAKAEGR